MVPSTVKEPLTPPFGPRLHTGCPAERTPGGSGRGDGGSPEERNVYFWRLQIGSRGLIPSHGGGRVEGDPSHPKRGPVSPEKECPEGFPSVGLLPFPTLVHLGRPAGVVEGGSCSFLFDWWGLRSTCNPNLGLTGRESRVGPALRHPTPHHPSTPTTLGPPHPKSTTNRSRVETRNPEGVGFPGGGETRRG